MSRKHFAVALLLASTILSLPAPRVLADGKVVAPRNYKGSLEEKAQEAIIIFEGGSDKESAVEHLILKIQVVGEADQFAWVVPFPSEPKTAREDVAMFRELFRYVDARQRRRRSPKKGFGGEGATKDEAAKDSEVVVLSRKVVGSYDVAVVREQKAGALNKWLVDEGYQSLDNADDVIGFYRQKGYVFACVKVTDVALEQNKSADLHPLRFTFKTGGRDGIYFPMRMTGLQERPFNVNLYVFYRAWLNDRLNKFGYVHRGFSLKHRDWDTSKCEPNAGKTWSAPESDPYLRDLAGTLPTVTKYFQKRHPGERFYLTNLQAFGLKPADVRDWTDDLWMFPYYVNRRFIPYDARQGGPAATAWRDKETSQKTGL